MDMDGNVGRQGKIVDAGSLCIVYVIMIKDIHKENKNMDESRKKFDIKKSVR